MSVFVGRSAMHTANTDDLTTNINVFVGRSAMHTANTDNLTTNRIKE